MDPLNIEFILSPTGAKELFYRLKLTIFVEILRRFAPQDDKYLQDDNDL